MILFKRDSRFPSSEIWFHWFHNSEIWSQMICKKRATSSNIALAYTLAIIYIYWTKIIKKNICRNNHPTYQPMLIWVVLGPTDKPPIMLFRLEIMLGREASWNISIKYEQKMHCLQRCLKQSRAWMEYRRTVAFVGQDSPLHNKKKNTAEQHTRVCVQIRYITIFVILIVYREIKSVVTIYYILYFLFR